MPRTGELIRLLRSDAPDFEARLTELESRRDVDAARIEAVVVGIVDDVRERGDVALLEAVASYDGYRLEANQLALDREAIAAGASKLDAGLREALTEAAARIRSYHELHVPESWERREAGEILGQRVRALRRVGLYVPAGSAPLASTVLMLGIPARVAGVPELVVATPGNEPHPALLEAARLAGVTRVIRMGGAQAIAALAFGTAHVPRVDKIVGPGNAYVQAAKRQVFGQVAIDAEAGPSEVWIIADATAPSELVAADLLAQAEHDEMASVVLATPSASLARATREALSRQLIDLPRAALARRALGGRSALIVTRDLDEAVALANRYAAEHVQIMTAEPERLLDRVENAGAVFLGTASPVPIGDYLAGPSHVLPTGGTARFFSVLGVEDFVKRSSVIQISPQAAEALTVTAARLARMEGLEAHARALEMRLKRGE
ncbi:MAG: histidinol dehydrogenase [Myxococcota bacterium]